MTHTESADLMLSTRIEQSHLGSRELDAEIAEAVGAPRGKKFGFCRSDNGDYFVIDESALAYTTSLDAALTLVPKEMVFNLGNDVRCWAHVWDDVVNYDGEGSEGRAETPALALAAAAMRVRGL